MSEHPPAPAGGEPRLVIAGLSHQSDDPFGTDLKDIHLTVRGGEIVGIAGVSGNGQQELLAALSGEAPLSEPCPVQILGGRPAACRPAAAASSASASCRRSASVAARCRACRWRRTRCSPRIGAAW